MFAVLLLDATIDESSIFSGLGINCCQTTNWMYLPRAWRFPILQAEVLHLGYVCVLDPKYVDRFSGLPQACWRLCHGYFRLSVQIGFRGSQAAVLRRRRHVIGAHSTASRTIGNNRSGKSSSQALVGFSLGHFLARGSAFFSLPLTVRCEVPGYNVLHVCHGHVPQSQFMR
jgi:hypothetical protein